MDVFNAITLIAAIYLLASAMLMSTENAISFLWFKLIPFVLSLGLFGYVATNMGWVINVL